MDHAASQERAARPTEVSLSEMRKKAGKASFAMSRGAAQVPAKLGSRSRDIEQELNRTIQMTNEVHKSITKGEKIANLEKPKVRAKAKLDDLNAECERPMTNSTTIEKRGRNFDGVVNEWRLTAGDLQNEITGSQADCHNYSSDYFCIKAANEEMLEHLDTARRENENLAEEIKDLPDQLGEGGRSMHQLDKSRRKLEMIFHTSRQLAFSSVLVISQSSIYNLPLATDKGSLSQ